MSGFGERFRRAGYSVPKPLIEVDGKPIIQYVVNMFPGETNFSFVCNEDHLNRDDYCMKEILSEAFLRKVPCFSHENCLIAKIFLSEIYVLTGR